MIELETFQKSKKEGRGNQPNLRLYKKLVMPYKLIKQFLFFVCTVYRAIQNVLYGDGDGDGDGDGVASRNTHMVHVYVYVYVYIGARVSLMR